MTGTGVALAVLFGILIANYLDGSPLYGPELLMTILFWPTMLGAIFEVWRMAFRTWRRT